MTDWDLRLGRWQDVLADVGEVDAVICDPPYGARTHAGHRAGVALTGSRWERANGKTDAKTNRQDITYGHFSNEDVLEMVGGLANRVGGWWFVLTSHDLWHKWEAALAGTGLYVFHPIPCVVPGMTVRLAGDGPSSWAVYGCAARPRWPEKWGTLPGAYNSGQGERSHIGGKPLQLMRQIIKDYTRPGDLVCDPCAGGGTTGRACQLEGRRFIGAEMDPLTHAKAFARLSEPYTVPMFREPERATQEGLFLDDK